MTGERRRSAFAAHLVNTSAAGEPPHVTDDLRRTILAGHTPPGTAIPIEAVARFYGVSPIPVREGLKVLIGEGLVDHVSHVGYSVAKLSFAEFRELYVVRQALEASALPATVRLATDETYAELREANDAMQTAGLVADAAAYAVASRWFHLTLIATAAMPRLLHMYESVWNMTEPARPMARVGDELRARFVGDHEELIEAARAGEIDRVLACSQRHYERLLLSFDAFGGDADLFRPEA